jgi:hypothetical protein
MTPSAPEINWPQIHALIAVVCLLVALCALSIYRDWDKNAAERKRRAHRRKHGHYDDDSYPPGGML